MTQAPVREFKMPDVGEGLTEAEILKWYVQPGDTVTDGQVVCEVETAKAAVELPIPYDGVVRALHFPEGTTVDVGTSIIAVDVSGGTAPEPEAPAAAPAAEAALAGAVSTAAAAPTASAGQPAEAAGSGRQPVLVGYGVSTSATRRRPRKPAPDGFARQAVAGSPAELNGHTQAAPVPAAAPAPTAGPVAGARRPLAKPPVRKLAKDLGVDLATVTATGPDGIVTREDVHAAVAAAKAPQEPAVVPAPVAPPAPAAASAPVAAPAPASYDTARETRIPVKGVRRATAAAMVGSAFTAPHVTEFVTVDVTRTMKLVEELKQDKEFTGLRVNPLLLIAKALLVAIRRNPDVNASWDEAAQEIVVKHYVNLGIAAATPRGLIVPNIKDAHAKTLPQLAESLGELVSTARDGKTSPAAMQAGTITITNVGVFGVDTGTPILNPGESAILAVGAIKLQPWVHKGKVKPRQVTTLALSFDHRLIDGELGSRFLADVAAILEQPKRLISWA
ncbi:pyruvate dehydrogenase E2 component (dihydrolipoamide acetyltransferase) [Streptomyces prasinopilosus]|uniref:Dihydrolipoamide acetyltransferase component of pyruvate dehydrogenase complex n=3 Tax=Streptomyces prasinopilosus TaxID=67344 RepID=A0A1G6Z6V5_9ACTN|nr:pyruvate dehydrogenase E2 component (dihydrolipoamide acetyltransferase) [Streptomyces prasinopilosus]